MSTSTALVRKENGRFDLDVKRELARRVCVLITNGDTVADACRVFGINRVTLWEWAAADEIIGNFYAQARSSSAWSYDDEALGVARRSTSETAAADRVKVDTLKWAAAKRRPREYGDKLTVAVTAENVRDRVRQTLEVVRRECTGDQAERIFAALKPIWA